jgi:hypothetical protein
MQKRSINFALVWNVAGVSLAAWAIHSVYAAEIPAVCAAFVSGLIVGLSGRYSVSLESTGGNE